MNSKKDLNSINILKRSYITGILVWTSLFVIMLLLNIFEDLFLLKPCFSTYLMGLFNLFIILWFINKKINIYISEQKKQSKIPKKIPNEEKIGSKDSLDWDPGKVGHDFNNILQTIIGYSTLLKEDLDSDSQSFKDVEYIYKSALKGKELTAQLLDLSNSNIKTSIAEKQNIEQTQTIAPKPKQALQGDNSSQNKTILIAEDDELIQDLLSHILKDAGYHIFKVSNGQEAVEFMKDSPPQIDLLLFDIVMPILEGPGAYQKIVIYYPNIPVAFTTGCNVDKIDIGFPISKNMYFIQKPYRKQGLLATLNEIFRG